MCEIDRFLYVIKNLIQYRKKYVINRYSVFRWKEEEKKWNEYIEKINQQV